MEAQLEHVLVVELAKPRLGPGGQTLAFRVKVLRGSPADLLREFAKRADRRVADAGPSRTGMDS